MFLAKKISVLFFASSNTFIHIGEIWEAGVTVASGADSKAGSRTKGGMEWSRNAQHSFLIPPEHAGLADIHFPLEIFSLLISYETEPLWLCLNILSALSRLVFSS